MAKRVEAQPPKVRIVEEGPFKGSEIRTHPAYGSLAVFSVHGGGRHRMYGSDLSHFDAVRIELREAEQHRDHSVDRHSPEKVIATVEMTESQWARFVASTGVGSGTPCTIRYRHMADFQEMPAISAPELSKKEQHGKEMRDRLQKGIESVTKAADKLSELANASGSISKVALREVLKELRISAEGLPNSVRFIYDMFHEATELVVDSAKLEIEAHVNNAVRAAGLESLRSLPEFDDTKKLEAK